MRLGPMWFMLGVLAVAGLLDGQAARGFATEFGIGFPLWIGPDGRSPAAFGVWAHPSTILIDRAG